MTEIGFSRIMIWPEMSDTVSTKPSIGDSTQFFMSPKKAL